MPQPYIIQRGVERLIINSYIESNNRVNWIANISKELNKESSNVERIIKNLTDRNILKKINCPEKLIEKLKKKREKGGAYPSDCYLLNYDMDYEWFVEIARPHLNDDDENIRLNFMESEFTHHMIHYKKFIAWILENRLIIKVNDEEKSLLQFILNSFPSTLWWVLFGDLSIVDKCISDITAIEAEIDLRKRFYFAYINSKAIEDFVNGEYLQHTSLSKIKYNFKTEFEFLNVSHHKSKEIGEKSYGILTGGSIFEFKKKSLRKNIIKKTNKTDWKCSDRK